MNICSPHRIVIGDRVIFDDDVLLDGKGSTSEGIRIGKDIYHWSGQYPPDQERRPDLGDGVNIGYYTTLSSTNRLRSGIGPLSVPIA